MHLYRSIAPYRSNQVFSKVIAKIPTIPGISAFRYSPYWSNQVFSKATPAIPTTPQYFEISVPTLPVQSGIFKCHTYNTYYIPVFEISRPTRPAQSGIFQCHMSDTHAHHGVGYPGKYRRHAQHETSPRGPVYESVV